MTDLIKELDAKAWQSARRGSDRKEHVCHRAAREIERLREIQDAPAAERGWRAFWQVFVDRLHLGHDQRTYNWHELMDCCSAGMEAVKRDTNASN